MYVAVVNTVKIFIVSIAIIIVIVIIIIIIIIIITITIVATEAVIRRYSEIYCLEINAEPATRDKICLILDAVRGLIQLCYQLNYQTKLFFFMALLVSLWYVLRISNKF